MITFVIEKDIWSNVSSIKLNTLEELFLDLKNQLQNTWHFYNLFQYLFGCVEMSTEPKSIIAFAEVRNLLPPSEESLKVYKNLNNDPKGRWRAIPLTAQAGHATPNQFYEITAPTGVKHNPPPGRCWSVTKERFNELLNEGRIYFGKDGSSQPNLIRYIDEIKGFVPWTWLPSNEVGHTDSAMKEFYSVLSKEALFDTPKPTSLIKHFLKIATKTNDLIFDFFSGTASTAHAVMQLNAEDGGNRRFIMVQLPESCDENSEAFKAGYKNIAEIGKERIRSAGQKILKELEKKDDQLDLGQDKIAPSKLDIGFRVYKVDSTNMKDVFYHPSRLKQDELDLVISNIKEDRSPEDLLTQVILDLGLELSLPIETRKILNNTVFIVQTNALAACFDNNIDFQIVDTIAELKPLKVVFKDDSFKDDKDRINVEERFKRLSPETIVTVI